MTKLEDDWMFAVYTYHGEDVWDYEIISRGKRKDMEKERENFDYDAQYPGGMIFHASEWSFIPLDEDS